MKDERYQRIIQHNTTPSPPPPLSPSPPHVSPVETFLRCLSLKVLDWTPPDSVHLGWVLIRGRLYTVSSIIFLLYIKNEWAESFFFFFFLQEQLELRAHSEIKQG